MPYKSGEVPGGTKNVPAHGQAIYRAAFNSAHEQGKSEQVAHAIAWAAVKKKYKKKGDKWVSKDADSIVWIGREDNMSTTDKEFSTERRKTLASEGKAMKGGGYPIENEQDLKNAIRAIGRAKNPAATKAHIKKRARALGLTKLLPETWDAMDDEPSGNFTCPECHGTGVDPDGDSSDGSCDECGGSGYIERPDNSSRKEQHETFPMRRSPDPALRMDRRRRDDDDEDNNDDDDLEDAQTVQLTDSFVMDAVRKTKDGYLVANARIARTGVQLYNGAEIGRPDLDVVRVYRPPSEVFNKQAMHSLAHKPVTLLHPPVMVDAANWDKYAVGHTGDEVTRDGECVRVPMVIMDAQAIKAFEKHGVKELSVGYSTDLKWGQGKTPSGEVYDAKQTAIRGNHLAVVPAARGGSRLSLGDDRTKGGTKMVQILIGDRLVSFDDEAEAAHVQAFVKELEDAKKKNNKEGSEEEEKGESAEEEQEEEKKLRAEKDAAIGEVAALKKQLEDALDPVKRDKAMKDSMELRLKANAVLDGKIDLDGKSDADIRRIVVTAKLGDDIAKTLNDGEIAGAFKAITADVKLRSGVDRLADSLAALNFGGGSNGNDPKAIKDAAYSDYVKNLTGAWRTPRAS